MKYTDLAIKRAEDLIYGSSPKPVAVRAGFSIGGGAVYPELNFTLPPMLISQETIEEVYGHYRMIVEGALSRAADLEAPGIVLECETLPPMTANPAWAEKIAAILLEGMKNAKDKRGLKSALRFTPNDNREMVRPPRLRSGEHWQAMLETFERVSALGVDMVSIESTGGKEIHDDALTMCDIKQSIFGSCVMGARDMEFLWDHIVAIAGRHGVTPAGDSACGFGNTAMVLAEQKLIPRVFAAVVRPITAVRSLVAHERGAIGPGKDCAYENPILKAITGCPMSMEGKTAACAHLSPVGNIAAAACDLWSNESVQNIKLLGGMAPTCYAEQLIYDCRLLNRAAADGGEGRRRLRDWLVDSDAGLDPQAYVLTPECSIRFGQAIVGQPTPYLAAWAVGLEAVKAIREAAAAGKVAVAPPEMPYLDAMEADLKAMPGDEGKFIAEMMDEVEPGKFVAGDYGL
ncbi:MAG: methanol--corrinoid methyltransferase [Planctomycetota bacterium]|jgi:methanol--5-hydroxybenzimidazolylcobamide Co-methyltransferase|nr:methanol--corrinoid methyltransferase [Planctomycetota bacterium]